MAYSIFVILGITATLLVFSLVMFFKARKKEKTFGVYFIIPICIGLMAITGMSFGLSGEIDYNKLMKEKTQEVLYFAEDYSYYIESWTSVIEYCENNEIDFSEEFNLEPTLNQEKLKHKVIAHDTFYTYFSRYYPRARNSYEGDLTISLGLRDGYYDEDGVIPFSIYKFSGTNYYGTPNFVSRNKLNQESNKIAMLINDAESISKLEFKSNYNSYYFSSGFTITEYIIMIVYTSLIVIFDLASMIYFFVRRKESEQTTTLTNNVINAISKESKTIEEQVKTIEETPPPPNPTWEQLKEEEQKIYINNAIKKLYEKQLNDINLELTRQQKALKKDCLENKEFYLEDLTEIEKIEVLEDARQQYNNNIMLKENKPTTQAKQPKKSDYRKQYFKSKGFKIRLGFYICLTVFLLGFVFDTIAGFVSEVASDSVFFTIGIAMSCVALLPLIILWNKKKEYCKVCGCKGEVKKIEALRNYQSVETPGVVTNEEVGHIHAECPNCHKTWKVRYSRKTLK